MSVGGFLAGQHLNWRGANFVIERLINGDRWQLRNLQTNETNTHELSELLRAYEIGDLIFQARAIIDSDPKAELKRLVERSLSSFPESDVANARNLERYCIALSSRRSQSLDPKSLQIFINETASELGDPNPPSPAKLYRDYKEWTRLDGDIRALMPRHWKKGNRDHNLDLDVRNIIDASIVFVLNHKEKRTSKIVHDEVVTRIVRVNKERAESDKLAIPSNRTIRTKIGKLSPYELAMMRHGKRHADYEFRCSIGRPEATAPLERVEFDFTPGDAIFLDETIGLPIGRCTTASTIDCYSHCCTALDVFPDFPNAANCLTTLRQAILPKTWLKEQYPNVKDDWPCFGVPNMIVFDNPWELIGKQVEKACVDLKFDIEFAPPRTGAFKGQIERFQQTTNFTLLHPAKGTTLSTYLDLIDYDPRKNALISLQEYKTQLYRWVVDVYNRTKQDKPCFIPVERWRDGMRLRDIPLPSSAASLFPVIGLHEEGDLQHYGLTYKYIHYNSTVLGELRRQFGNKQHLKFVVDSQNLGSIQVMHPRNGIYFTVPANRPEYAEGLKLYQHVALIRAAEIKAKHKVDEIELAQIRNEICWNLSGKLAKKNPKFSRRELFTLQAEIQSKRSAPQPKSAARPARRTTTPPEIQQYETEWL
jgi:putative transposase